jgi:hypothetical protein
MNKAEKRAIKIIELQEELEQAKAIIEGFVWPPDATREQRESAIKHAARFAGCVVPLFDDGPDECKEQP